MKDVQDLFRQGKVREADELAKRYEQAYPNNPEVPYARAVMHESVRSWQTAAELAARAVDLAPGEERYQVMLGRVLIEGGRLPVAEEEMRKARAMLPQSLAVQMSLGVALMMQHKLAEAEEIFQRLLERNPDSIPVRSNLAQCWQRMRRFDDALALLGELHDLQPNVLQLKQSLIRCWMDAGQTEEASEFIARWIDEMPGVPEAWYEAGRFYEEVGRIADARKVVERARMLAPGRAEVAILYGRLLVGEDRDVGLRLIEEGLLAQPQNAEGHVSIAAVLKDAGLWNEALQHASRAVALAPNDARLIHRAAMIHRAAARQSKSTLDMTRQLLARAEALAPFDEDTAGDYYVLRRELADWSGLMTLERKVLDFNQQFFSWPFNMLSMEQATRADQLLAGRHYATGLKGRLEAAGAVALPQRNIDKGVRPTRLKVGYLSSDFRVHPVAVLAAEAFESHDRSRFEVFAYALGKPSDDSLRRRMREAFEHFTVIEENEDAADLAARIRHDGIDVLVDLNGYTADSRIEVLALRPAPVQAVYLGYPGTSGSDFVDYLITDAVVVPPEDAADYTEKLAYVSGTYMPNDSTRSIANGQSREAWGLPEEGFVFACFNQFYKITEPVFDIWAEILRAVPGSVLWLPEGEAEARTNIQREADKRGIASQLVFAARASDPAVHLGRLALADLGLDTRPYNMHATACDMLWAGVPIVTAPGETLASRVVASVLSALVMPELIARNLAAYRDLAIKLATDAERLGALREKLAGQRLTSGVFDGRTTAKDLESLYDQMWARAAEGMAPDHLRAGKT